MSDDFENDKPRLPSHIAYNVEEGGEEKSYWHRIGSAWENKDGGLNLKLSATPVDGRVVLRPRSEVERLKKARRQAQEETQRMSIKP